jgi:KaiC/GvpD/RAD55 family RecA-like ATPase
MEHNYLKELVSRIDNNASFVMINKKVKSKALDYLIERLLMEKDDKVVFVSLTKNNEDILNKFNSPKLIVVDCFNDSKKNHEKTIHIGSHCSLTNLQIGVEKACERLKGEIIIVIDSVNMLGLYNNKTDLAKFIYLFSNKTKLEGHSSVLFGEKESLDDDTLEKIKGFSDNVFDYSTISDLTVERER